jgi:hypothetical protein
MPTSRVETTPVREATAWRRVRIEARLRVRVSKVRGSIRVSPFHRLYQLTGVNA